MFICIIYIYRPWKPGLEPRVENIMCKRLQGKSPSYLPTLEQHLLWSKVFKITVSCCQTGNRRLLAGLVLEVATRTRHSERVEYCHLPTRTRHLEGAESCHTRLFVPPCRVRTSRAVRRQLGQDRVRFDASQWSSSCSAVFQSAAVTSHKAM